MTTSTPANRRRPHRHRSLESRMRLTAHVRFGGGPSEQGQYTWHLAGGLPDPKRNGKRRPLGLTDWSGKLADSRPPVQTARVQYGLAVGRFTGQPAIDPVAGVTS